MNWGLSLGGGTALGAVQVPIIEHLFGALGAPKEVAGVSVGAVNAALTAEHRLVDLRDEWASIRGTGDFAARQADPWNGLRSLRPLRRRLEARRAGAALRCPCWAGLVDIADEEYRSVGLHDLADLSTRHDAIIGSASQPWPVFEAADLCGRPVVDGGAGGHVLPPLPGWRELGELHVVSCSPIGVGRRRRHQVEQIRAPWKRTSIAFAMLLSRQANEDAEDFEDLARANPAVKVWLYAPSSWEAVGDPFDASPEDIQRRFAEGERMVQTRRLLGSS